jgi:nitrate reductase NapE component
MSEHNNLPDDHRVTSRVPAPLAFILRMLLIVAIVGLIAFIVWLSVAADAVYIHWQVERGVLSGGSSVIVSWTC